jgi:hypothetical protein
MTQESFPEYEIAPLNTWWLKTEKTPEKNPPERNLSLAMAPFQKLAKAECSNYSEFGPRHIKHYCSMQPPQSQKQCLLCQGYACSLFIERVLPLNPELAEEWKQMMSGRSDPHQDDVQPAPKALFKTCSCGKRFKRNSPRQSLCDECGKKNRARLSRITSQRHREKQVAA